MKIENRNGEANVSFVVDDIEGDMGQDTRLRLLVQADGDVVLSLTAIDGQYRGSIEFCSSNGGGIPGDAQVTYIRSYGACFGNPSEPSPISYVLSHDCSMHFYCPDYFLSHGKNAQSLFHILLAEPE